MATLREYFDGDFNYAARVHVKFQDLDFQNIEAVVLYDFAGFFAFLACYVKGEAHKLPYFFKLLEAIQFGRSKVNLDGKVTLPSARAFPGELQVHNRNPFEILARFHGDPEWVSINEIQASRRILIYSESELTNDELLDLKQKARDLGHNVQFRSLSHAVERSKHEKPLAFISHDWQDKISVARKIAVRLQGLMCPVWYDEFSLKVGDNLRTSIETGLKTCKKCVLVLSPNFFSNKGWTKKEFDSIFTREILEQRQVVLPVWYGVSKQDVYAYSPSLLNVKGIDWNELGEEEVCRQLYQAILDEDAGNAERNVRAF